MSTNSVPMHFYQLLRKYLTEYLRVQRNHPETTIKTYKDSLNQYRIYLKEIEGIPFDKVDFSCFSRNQIYKFCTWLRNDQKRSANTINLRLSSIQSFLKYCGDNDPEVMIVYLEASKIRRFKDTNALQIKYLEQDQLKVLFSHPDLKTRSGRRNQYFMIHAYETGGRVEELVKMKLKDLIYGKTGIQIRLHGKGDKTRYIPFPDEAVCHLEAYLKEFHPQRDPEAYLFYTKHNGEQTQMSPRTVNSFLSKYGREIQSYIPDFPKNLHCHIFRHSIGMAMFKSGIPLPYIKDYLGHSSIDSTSIYAHTDTEMMEMAITTVNEKKPSLPNNSNSDKKWKGSEEQLLAFCGLS